MHMKFQGEQRPAFPVEAHSVFAADGCVEYAPTAKGGDWKGGDIGQSSAISYRWKHVSSLAIWAWGVGVVCIAFAHMHTRCRIGAVVVCL